MEMRQELDGIDSVANQIERFLALMDEGFEDVLQAWGLEEVLPSWYHDWPRPEWEPLKPSTIARKRAGGYGDVALVREGALIAAATFPNTRGNVFEVNRPSGSFGEIEMGVSEEIPYAIKQEYGEEEENIPARPWDEIGDDLMESLAHAIDVKIRAALG